MPVQKFSAMDPSGSWNMDARDQTAMWNADRGDRINMWQTNRADQSGRDAWQRDVALKQLGLQSEMYQGGREDSASARQAEANRWGQQFDYMRGRDASGENRWQQEFDLNKRGADLQLSEAERLTKERAEKAASAQRFRATLGGGMQGMDPKQAAFLKMMADSGAPDDVLSSMAVQIAGRPLETQFRRDDARTQAAEDAVAALEGNRFAGQKQANELKRVAERGGIKDIIIGRGQMVPPEQVKMNAPEYSQIVDGMREQLKNLPETWFSGEGEGVGNIIMESLQANANEMAKQYGTDPNKLAKLMYLDVVQGNPGDRSGFVPAVGRVVANAFTLGQAGSQPEIAREMLRQKYGQ